jgi:hypothetical protein
MISRMIAGNPLSTPASQSEKITVAMTALAILSMVPMFFFIFLSLSLVYFIFTAECGQRGTQAPHPVHFDSITL